MQIRTLFFALAISPALIGATEHKAISSSALQQHAKEASHTVLNSGAARNSYGAKTHGTTSAIHVVVEATKHYDSPPKETYAHKSHNTSSIRHDESKTYNHDHGKSYEGGKHTVYSHGNLGHVESTSIEILVAAYVTSTPPGVFTLMAEATMTETMTIEATMIETMTAEATMTETMMVEATMTETTIADAITDTIMIEYTPTETMLTAAYTAIATEPAMTETETPIAIATPLSTGAFLLTDSMPPPTPTYTAAPTPAFQSAWMTTLPALAPASASFTTVIGTGGMSAAPAVFTGGAGRAGMSGGVGLGLGSWVVGGLFGVLAWV